MIKVRRTYPKYSYEHTEISVLETAEYKQRNNPYEAGIVPLENHLRIGPLRPGTCQSVRMQFLALRPGVHLISTLTLTDIEFEYSINLR